MWYQFNTVQSNEVNAHFFIFQQNVIQKSNGFFIHSILYITQSLEPKFVYHLPPALIINGNIGSIISLQTNNAFYMRTTPGSNLLWLLAAYLITNWFKIMQVLILQFKNWNFVYYYSLYNLSKFSAQTPSFWEQFRHLKQFILIGVLLILKLPIFNIFRNCSELGSNIIKTEILGLRQPCFLKQ